MSVWSVQIVGDNFDLDDLPGWFNSNELKVVKEANGYYLYSNRFSSVKDAKEVRIIAEKLVEKMLGAAMLIRSNLKPFKLGNVNRQNEDGSKDIYFKVSIKASTRSKATFGVYSNGVAQKANTSKAALIFDVADNDKKVEHALRIWGKEPHDWINMYKILEIIESDVGGKIYQEGLANKSEVDRFTQTANSVEALGDKARHGIKKVPLPKKPMTIQEAQYLIRSLINKWIDSKVSSA